MIAAAVALVVIGLVLSLFLGYFGFIVSAVGIVLFVLALLGFRRRTVETGR